MAMVIPNQSFLYKLLSRMGVVVISIAEWLITKTSGSEVFFDCEKFAWVKEVEAKAPEMISELETVLKQYEAIPELKNLSAGQERIVAGNRWKSFFFYAYGERVAKNCLACPQTDAALHNIPYMVTAFYSILEPHTKLTPHRGPYKGVLRYHLALKVPDSETGCALKIADEIKHWHTGTSLIFDDSYMHEAWNNTDEIRVVLFVDFVRLLPFPISVINRGVIWLMAKSPFIQNLLAKV